VFETYALYPNKTVAENLAFPLRIRKVQKDEIDRKVREVAELLDIVPELERKPAQLSGGQRQRVSIGRAIVRNPKVFLMDEPISHLDAKLREHMRSELKRMQKELDATTVYVTHDQMEALSMADKVVVMNFGVLQQMGTPDEIYNKPSNVFIANFVGSPSMNFVECEYEIQNRSLVLRIHDSNLRVKKTTQELESLTKESSSNFVTMGIRPEHIKIYKASSDGNQYIPGEVYVTEPLGDIVIVDVKVGQSIMKVKTEFTTDFEINDRVWLEFNIERIHIFDANTGIALC
jgi:multiple sugar transport system ATP-binding protein